MKNLFKHLKTVHIHRKHVRKMCWKMGLFWQGLTHDLSKYSITELKICKYYSGKQSPHQNCREKLGYSPSWIHHFHKNKHHYEYWIETNQKNDLVPIKMPFKYVVESLCDTIGAGKAYAVGKGIEWKCEDPWYYYQENCAGRRIINEHSDYLLRKLLWNLKEKGMQDFLTWYNSNKKYLNKTYDNDCLEELDEDARRVCES